MWYLELNRNVLEARQVDERTNERRAGQTTKINWISMKCYQCHILFFCHCPQTHKSWHCSSCNFLLPLTYRLLLRWTFQKLKIKGKYTHFLYAMCLWHFKMKDVWKTFIISSRIMKFFPSYSVKCESCKKNSPKTSVVTNLNKTCFLDNNKQTNKYKYKSLKNMWVKNFSWVLISL